MDNHNFLLEIVIFQEYDVFNEKQAVHTIGKDLLGYHRGPVTNPPVASLLIVCRINWPSTSFTDTMDNRENITALVGPGLWLLVALTTYKVCKSILGQAAFWIQFARLYELICAHACPPQNNGSQTPP